MSRRRRSAESSLELLLDTICNTFGGVLFMAILICVLLESSGGVGSVPTQERVSEADLLALEKDHTRTLAELESLQTAAAQQRELIDKFATPETTALVTDWQAAETRRDALFARRLELAGNIGERQTHINQMQDEMRQQEASLKALEEQEKDAQRSLMAEIAARSQAARLPMQRTTSKREIGMVLRYGRLYVLHQYADGGLRLGLNADDFAILEDDANRFLVTPIPYRGVSVPLPGESQVELRARLGRFDSRTQYLAFAAWGDSFEQFQHLKAILIDMRFEYRLLPMAPGENFSDRGGRDSRVQ